MNYCPHCGKPLRETEPPTKFCCEHQWTLEVVTTAGFQYRCVKCGLTKCEPITIPTWVIT